MRILLLLGLLLLATLPTRAQQLAPAADSLARPAAAVAAPTAAPDTAAALHRYFRDRRQLRTVVLVGTGLVYGIAVVTGSDKYGSYDGTAIRLVSYTPPLLGVLIGELVGFGRYSRRHERQALALLQAHRLPTRLAERLKPRYFVEH